MFNDSLNLCRTRRRIFSHLEIHDRHGGNAYGNGLLKPVHRYVLRLYGGVSVGRAVARRGVEHLGVGSLERNSEPVVCPVHGHEIAYNDYFLALGVYSAEDYDRLLVVVRGNPVEAPPGIVLAPKRSIIEIELIEVFYEAMEVSVALKLVEQEPVKPGAVVPLLELSKLAAHKEHLFSGVSHHIAHERLVSQELHVGVARHLLNQGALAVHHLVVGYRKNKVFREGVEE